LSIVNCLIVDDDVNCRREVPFSEVWALAEDARRIIWPSKWPRDPELKQLFARGAVLALMFFSRDWLLSASRGTKRKRPEYPSVYWVGALRNGLEETQGYPKFDTIEEARCYISQLLNAVAPVAAEVVAQCDRPELLAVADGPQFQRIEFKVSPEEQAAAARRLDASEAEKLLRLREVAERIISEASP
jgi:hypothetical protein